MSRIVITLGEPAGIGPDLGVLLAEIHLNKNTIIIGDPDLLSNSAKKLKKAIKLNLLENIHSKTINGKGVINLLPVKLQVKNKPGKLNPKNSPLFSVTSNTRTSSWYTGTSLISVNFMP